MILLVKQSKAACRFKYLAVKNRLTSIQQQYTTTTATTTSNQIKGER